MSELCDVDAVKSILDKTNNAHDGLIELLIAGVSARMERHMGCTIGTEEYTAEPIESPGFPAIVLDNGPVTRVITVVENDTTLTSADYRLEGGTMLVRLSSGAATRWATGTVLVTYEAGYEEIPPDLELACAMQVAREFKLTNAGGARLGVVSSSPAGSSGESQRYEMKPWLPEVESAMSHYTVLI